MMSSSALAAKLLESGLSVYLSGGTDTDLTGVASIAAAGPQDVVFVESRELHAEAVASKAGAIILPDAWRSGSYPFADLQADDRTRLFARNPRLAFAIAAKLLTATDVAETEIHPSAVIHPSARIGDRVKIEAHVIIGSDVIIGAGTHIYSRVVIYPRTTIGRKCVIHAGAVLGADGFGYVRDDDSGEYTQFPQQGTLILGDNVEVGANSTIDRGALDETVIGSGVKIDNMVHIGHNVQIGKNVVIAAQTGISGSSVIGEGAVIAGQVGIADHVTIGEGVILGAQCGVPSNKKITGPGQLFWGTPARPIQQCLKELALLARSAKLKKG